MWIENDFDGWKEIFLSGIEPGRIVFAGDGHQVVGRDGLLRHGEDVQPDVALQFQAQLLDADRQLVARRRTALAVRQRKVERAVVAAACFHVWQSGPNQSCDGDTAKAIAVARRCRQTGT